MKPRWTEADAGHLQVQQKPGETSLMDFHPPGMDVGNPVNNGIFTISTGEFERRISGCHQPYL